MNKAILIRIAIGILATALVTPFALAANPDVVAPIHQFIDGFNTGDLKSAYAAYGTGDIVIIDEFAPHRWVGPNAAHEWAADFDKHSTATGVTDTTVKYGAPDRTEVEGNAAYVILPTTYLYKDHGKPFTEEGRMTFVLHSESGAWKITSWVWTGTKPHPAK